MNKTISITDFVRAVFLITIGVFGVLAVQPARAGNLIGAGSLITTAQTNSATFTTNVATVNLPVIYVSNGNITATNSYTGYFRYSFDNVTFFTNASPAFSPTSSNSATYTIQPQTFTVPVYVQMLAVTNSSANTGAINISVFTP